MTKKTRKQRNDKGKKRGPRRSPRTQNLVQDPGRPTTLEFAGAKPKPKRGRPPKNRDGAGKRLPGDLDRLIDKLAKNCWEEQGRIEDAKLLQQYDTGDREFLTTTANEYAHNVEVIALCRRLERLRRERCIQLLRIATAELAAFDGLLGSTEG